MQRRVVLLALALGCSVYTACGDPPVDEADADATEAPAPAPPPPAPTAAASRRTGCVRSGFTPDEVRAALGAPDSIAGGWWVYGRTQILFSYGTVQDWNDGDSIMAC